MGLLRRRSPLTPEALVGTPEFTAKATLEDVEALAGKGDLEGLASLMASPNKAVRREALKVLSATDTAGTTETLRSAFVADGDLGIRQAAAETLAARGEGGPLERLLLEGPPEAQTRAARVLLGLGRAGTAILGAALDTGNPSLTLRILRVVELHFRLGSDEQCTALRQTLEPVLPQLIRALDAAEVTGGAKSYGEVVAVTIGALGRLKHPDAIPSLERLLTAVQAKVERDGVERQFVDDGVKAGYVSPLDEMKHIVGAIVACGGAEEKYRAVTRPTAAGSG